MEIWGLQAKVANKLDTTTHIKFRDAMLLAAARIANKEDSSVAVIDAIIACMQYANALGINVDELAGERVKELGGGS